MTNVQLLNRLKSADLVEEYYRELFPEAQENETGNANVRCPFHEDENPSCSINFQTGLFNCHGCGMKGNIFTFRAKTEGISKQECIAAFEHELEDVEEVLAEDEPAEAPSGTYTVTTRDIHTWNEALFEDHIEEKKFLNDIRGFNDETLKKFFVCVDPIRKDIVVPVFDAQGKEVISAKYFRYDLQTGQKTSKPINCGQTQILNLKVLNTDYERCGFVVIAEGEFDAMILNQNGFPAVTGTGGAETWKREWSAYFRDKNVVICYDSDETGRRGAKKVATQLQSQAKSIRVLDLFGRIASQDRKDVTDYFVKEKKTATEFQALIDNCKSAETVDAIDYYTALEIENTTIEKPKFLLDGLLKQRSLNFLAGEPGSGKSFLALNLAMSVAFGLEKFLIWQIQKTGKVLYLNFELPEDEFKFRIQSLSKKHTANKENFIGATRHISLLDDWEAVRAILIRYKPIMFVIDCLYFAHNEDEDNNSKMKTLMRGLLTLRDEFETCILVVHHTKKGGHDQKMRQDQMRGAGVFSAVTDTTLMMRTKEEQMVSGLLVKKYLLNPVKLRSAAYKTENCRQLKLLDGSGWFYDDGIADEDTYIEQFKDERKLKTDFNFTPIFDVFGNPYLNRKQLVACFKAGGISEITADRAIQKACDNGILTKRKKNQYVLVI
jgi:5S rRNA maturation endonuclease (ribonuclease M5)